VHNKPQRDWPLGLLAGTNKPLKPLQPFKESLKPLLGTISWKDFPVHGYAVPRCWNALTANCSASVHQALAFGSRSGAEVALYLQIQRLHAQWVDESWWETSHALYFDLGKDKP
jgi:hypothetical protein